LLGIIYAHRHQKDKRIAYRLNSILLLNKGFSFAEVSDILLLDDDTIRRNYTTYTEQGLNGLESYDYSKPLSYLSPLELKALDAHLTKTMYLHSKNIKHYIETTYGVIYTVEGVRLLLKRLNFVYKKQNTCLVRVI